MVEDLPTGKVDKGSLLVSRVSDILCLVPNNPVCRTPQSLSEEEGPKEEVKTDGVTHDSSAILCIFGNHSLGRCGLFRNHKNSNGHETSVPEPLSLPVLRKSSSACLSSRESEVRRRPRLWVTDVPSTHFFLSLFLIPPLI